ncbi:uncharacterized protein LOC119382233 [Rhipicephalus sanguineus]|uniref:uncharacterized protein LOC119382233 n=1 Tax=Rhipicephalus sanguineus TaxID=34632 RepID=UPI0020C43BF2|nr:uncharacterized protein LOC119382233 [Rhipicephalus sanguineus]
MPQITSSEVMEARIEDGVVYSPYPNVDIPLCSFYALVKDNLRQNINKTALVDGPARVTRGQLLALMECYAVGFQQHGVGAGDRVCALLTNSLENLAAMYGCAFAGATLILAKTSVTERELRNQITSSDSTHVLVDAKLAEKVKGVTSTISLKVVDPVFYEKLGANQTGEIWFRGPTVMLGYYKHSEETIEFFDSDGWGKTGDAGYYDKNGRFFFVQRLKEMIKCMENQVAPAELEELLLQEHPEDIAEVAVVGLADPRYGEAPAAAVVPKDKKMIVDHSDFRERIQATIAENMAVHKHLYGGVFLFDSLPKNEIGKVNRSALVQKIAATTPS